MPTPKGMPTPKFTQIMGECCTKEWVAKVPWDFEDEKESYWVLLRICNMEDCTGEKEFMVELFDSISDIDWVELDRKRTAHFELLVQQFFTCRLPEWTDTGPNPLVLMHRAVQHVMWSYL